MLINKTSPHGGDIYKNKVTLDFSANVNACGAPASVIDAVRNLDAGDIIRYPDPYCTELRRALSLWYDGVNDDSILCGDGASELIYAFAYTLADHLPPSPALIVSPTFCEYETALTAAGVPVEYYDMSCRDLFSLTDGILRLDLERYCAVFVCSPNNPTGNVVDNALIEELAKRCRYLFLDTCFLSLSDAHDDYNIATLTERYPSLVILDAFTKSFGLAGLRLGWCVCSDEKLLSAMSEKSPCWNVSSVAQTAGIAAVKETEWLSHTREIICRERESMRERLGDIGIFSYPGRANYLLLRTGIPLYEPLLHGYGILVRDCSRYRGLNDPDAHYTRVAVREHSQNLQLIDAIDKIIKEGGA